MAQLVSRDEIESLRVELSEAGASLRSSFRRHTSSFRTGSPVNVKDDVDEECVLQWAEIERLPTFERLRSSLFETTESNGAGVKGKQVIDVTKLGSIQRHVFVDKLIKHIEYDNLLLLQKLRKRIDKVGVKLPTVEVKYSNLRIEAQCKVVHGKPLPSMWNSLKSMLPDFTKLPGLNSQDTRISIIKDVSGVIKPGRLTLLLGPPGCGKTTFLKGLSGSLNASLKMTGEISYNGYKLEEFVPQRTSAYISQYDLHIPEMTVRETLDFSARCLGVGNRADILLEVSRREKEAGIIPDPDIDTYMKATSVKGQKTTLQTDYIRKILGLDICADVLVGDAMRRGISGGQKKRLTTGEMIVGPTRALFMDEISNGLDSSTTYQVVSFLQQLAHITDATIVVSLLQPAPETFDLFDDIILMAEGKVVYHGPRSSVLEFFESCGFKCPRRKGVADFIQEVMSRKDQAQYWKQTEGTYDFISVDSLSSRFKDSSWGKQLERQMSKQLLKSESHRNAICFSTYPLSKWTLLKACISREFLLMKRNSFVYVFKSTQLFIIASVTMTVFLRTRMDVDLLHANSYMGALFYSLVILLVDGFPELSMTVARLSVFYKQRDMYFYPAWAYAIPAAILKIPLSFLESFVWTCLTYYVIGYTPEPGRFFRQLILLFGVHFTSISMFRFLASIFRTMVATITAGSLSILFVLLFGGFIIPKSSMPIWLSWGFWASPITYGEIGLAVNEFLAPRWQQMLPTNVTTGQETLASHGLNFDGYVFWISLCALFGFTLIFNIGFTLALSFLKSPTSRPVVSSENLSLVRGGKESTENAKSDRQASNPHLMKHKEPEKGKMVLPFEPLAVVFTDLQYYVETPQALREHGFTQKKLQLLHDITAVLSPGVLTALMGVSGAGKTTLLDVLAGRKTSGTVEGVIKIGGYPKVQETFARVSGYCEQNDVHSPQVTVEESIIFSAWLRLHPHIDPNTKLEFVKEVIETIELEGIKDALVGMPGVSGLSTEQRKRLTIAVELVANPSIIFMDEPTTGLDARAAAIVMRAVKNVADTGRTIVCTIHQPSIDIFETFDELILLKSGGRMIYSGPLGYQSTQVIEYFEAIPSVPRINNNYNPATWMLEITSSSAEAELGVDFAEIYKKSALYERNRELARRLSTPVPGSKELHFETRFSQNAWGQFKSCLWKQHLSYWRSPSFNLTRSMFILFASFLFAALFWDQGRKINNQQNLFNILGAMFIAVIFCGINNASSVSPYVSTERMVLYRERFSGMYAPWAYALAQVTIEVPYLFAQALAFTVITYPMIGYYGSLYKVFWYFYSMFCTLLYFTFLGMLVVSVTPSYPVASVLQSAFYTMLNLFSGFVIPQSQIPNWWIWFYYLIPTSWSLNGMFTSQYGDLDHEISAFGETKKVSIFLKDYFGYDYNELPVVAVILICYPLVFALLFAFCIHKLNFQRR